MDPATPDQSAIEYLVKGVGPDGKRGAARVTATSGAAALEALQDQGWAEAELVTDDMQRYLMKAADEEKNKDVFTATEEAAFMRMTPLGRRLWMVGRIFREFWVIAALAVGFLVWQRLRQVPFSWLEVAAWVALSLPILYVLVTFTPGTAVHTRIQRHMVRAEWEEVLAALPALGRSIRKMGPEACAVMVAETRAKALAATGRLDEALRAMDGLTELPGMAPHAMWLRRGNVNSYGRDWRAAEACYLSATEIRPEDALAWISLAELYCDRVIRPIQAKAALQMLDSMTLAPETASAVRTVRAYFELVEGRNEQARRALEALLPEYRALAVHVPIAELTLAALHAKLVIACARTGDRDSARRHFAHARPYLEWHKETKTLNECKAAIGE